MTRVCPLSLIGFRGGEIANCVEEICMFWVFEKDCCALLLYLTEEEKYIPENKTGNEGFA